MRGEQLGNKRAVLTRGDTHVTRVTRDVTADAKTSQCDADDGPFYEVLVPKQLAATWQVPGSWIMQQTRSRNADPIPHSRLGKYVRFGWGSPELNEWWQRRQYRSRNGE